MATTLLCIYGWFFRTEAYRQRGASVNETERTATDALYAEWESLPVPQKVAVIDHVLQDFPTENTFRERFEAVRKTLMSGGEVLIKTDKLPVDRSSLEDSLPNRAEDHISPETTKTLHQQAIEWIGVDTDAANNPVLVSMVESLIKYGWAIPENSPTAVTHHIGNGLEGAEASYLWSDIYYSLAKSNESSDIRRFLDQGYTADQYVRLIAAIRSVKSLEGDYFKDIDPSTTDTQGAMRAGVLSEEVDLILRTFPDRPLDKLRKLSESKPDDKIELMPKHFIENTILRNTAVVEEIRVREQRYGRKLNSLERGDAIRTAVLRKIAYFEKVWDAYESLSRDDEEPGHETGGAKT